MNQSGARVLLVGHCGPDSSYLRISVASALPGAKVDFANDDAQLQAALSAGVELILFNRELDGLFSRDTGVEMIRALRNTHPQIKTMLVSNYPEAQAAAVAAGGQPGFGKRQLGTSHVAAALRQALEISEPTRA